MRPTTLVRVVVLIGAASMIAIGIWCRIDPAGFADWAGWPHHEHFLHDAGIFQVAIGLMMLLAVWLRDPVSIGLVGFVVASALHAHNHYVDRADGGRDGDWIPLLALAALGGIALFLHLRSQRHVKAPDATTR